MNKGVDILIRLLLSSIKTSPIIAPDIDDALSSSDVITREGSNVSLACTAYGSPKPSIKWKRDDGEMININKTLTVAEFEGNNLEMTRISRLDMGAYLCIASNGVPPSVSKRIRLSVDFPPMLWIPHQLVGAPQGYNVTLECFTEAHPNSLNYWTREDGQMIHDTAKYYVQSKPLELPYKKQMMLTIISLKAQDFGTYKCVAKNSRGETDGTIRLYDTQADLGINEVNRTSEKDASRREKAPNPDKGSSSHEKLLNKKSQDYKTRPPHNEPSSTNSRMQLWKKPLSWRFFSHEMSLLLNILLITIINSL